MSPTWTNPKMKLAEPWGKGPARVWGLILKRLREEAVLGLPRALREAEFLKRLREETVHLEAVALCASRPF